MPGWHLLAYNAAAAGINTVNLDFTAVTEPDFTSRNGHFILTDPYQLGGIMLVGASVIRGRLQIPTYNAIGEFSILSANRALQPTSNAQWDSLIGYTPQLPINEEIQVQVSNNLGAATEQENALLLLLATDWSRNLPQSSRMPPIIPVRATFTVTPTINAWSGPQAINLSQALRGGVYAVVGAVCQGTNAAAFRLIFPRYRLWHGRKLRPGWPVQNAIGDVVQTQIDPWVIGMGEWGRFHTFELPQAEVLGTTAASTTYQLFLWLVFLGEDVSQLNQGLGGGM